MPDEVWMTKPIDLSRELGEAIAEALKESGQLVVNFELARAAQAVVDARGEPATSAAIERLRAAIEVEKVRGKPG